MGRGNDPLGVASDKGTLKNPGAVLEKAQKSMALGDFLGRAKDRRTHARQQQQGSF
jgi:hypothetical protein